jgi:hypothetical protein
MAHHPTSILAPALATFRRRLPLEPMVLVTLAATILATACSASWSVELRAVAHPFRAVALVALAGLALALALSRPVDVRGDRVAQCCAAGFLLLAAASTAWSVAPTHTAERAGAFALGIVIAAALAVAVAGDAQLRRRVLLAVLAGAVLVAIFGLGAYAISSDGAIQPATAEAGARFRGVGQNPNTCAMLFAVSLPLTALFGLERRTSRARLAAGAAFGLLAGSIVASGSRGALVPACIGLLAFGFVLATRTAPRAAVVGAVAAFGAASIVIGTAAKPLSAAEGARARSPFGNTERYTPRDAQYVIRLEDETGYAGYRAPSGRSLLSTSGRLDAWRGALEQGGHRALLGYGFGTEANVFVDRFQSFQGGVPENSFLGLFLQLGALGVVLFVSLAAAVARSAAFLARRDRALGAACIAVLAVGVALALVQSYVYALGNVATLAFWVCALLPTVEAAE